MKRLPDRQFIDGTMKGSVARFVNHSCDPNCYIEKWQVDDKIRIGIFAKRRISTGEELTFDYNVDRSSGCVWMGSCAGRTVCVPLTGILLCTGSAQKRVNVAPATVRGIWGARINARGVVRIARSRRRQVMATIVNRWGQRCETTPSIVPRENERRQMRRDIAYVANVGSTATHELIRPFAECGTANSGGRGSEGLPNASRRIEHVRRGDVIVRDGKDRGERERQLRATGEDRVA